MKCKTKDGLLFNISCICMALFSGTFIVMPYASEEAEKANKIGLYFTGAAFWLCMLVGYSLVCVISTRRRKYFRQQDKKLKQSIHFPGILRFFSNKTAIIFDFILIISFISLIICQLTVYKNGMSTYIILAAVVFSLHMHGMFNGKNYYYIKEI